MPAPPYSLPPIVHRCVPFFFARLLCCSTCCSLLCRHVLLKNPLAKSKSVFLKIIFALPLWHIAWSAMRPTRKPAGICCSIHDQAGRPVATLALHWFPGIRRRVC